MIWLCFFICLFSLVDVRNSSLLRRDSYDVPGANYISNILKNAQKYNKDIMPSVSGPVRVKAKLNIVTMHWDQENLNWKIELDMSFVWRDQRINIQKSGRGPKMAIFTNMTQFWLPVFSFREAISIRLIRNAHYIELKRGGTVTANFRLSGKFRSQSNLVDYPFDNPSCRITFQNAEGLTSRDISFQVSSFLLNQGYLDRNFQLVSESVNLDSERVELFLQFHRLLPLHSIRWYLICIMIVIICTFGEVITIHEYRYAHVFFPMTSLATLVYCWTVYSKSLVSTPYINALDLFTYVSEFTISLLLLLAAVRLHWMHKNDAENGKKRLTIENNDKVGTEKVVTKIDSEIRNSISKSACDDNDSNSESDDLSIKKDSISYEESLKSNRESKYSCGDDANTQTDSKSNKEENTFKDSSEFGEDEDLESDKECLANEYKLKSRNKNLKSKKDFEEDSQSENSIPSNNEDVKAVDVSNLEEDITLEIDSKGSDENLTFEKNLNCEEDNKTDYEELTSKTKVKSDTEDLTSVRVSKHINEDENLKYINEDQTSKDDSTSSNEVFLSKLNEENLKFDESQSKFVNKDRTSIKNSKSIYKTFADVGKQFLFDIKCPLIILGSYFVYVFCYFVYYNS